MHNGRKNIIAFDEFVNLRLYNASGHYISKTIHTVISPSLCVPILLGLPFLKHNNIVIDIEAKTAIDKKNNFDLLNPSLPEKPKFGNSKMKFNYEYHANILKLRKSLLDGLKVTLSCRKNKTRSEHVQRVNVIAAVQVRLEQLTAQDQLDQMGAEIPRTYSTVFEPCPHTEDLPTDVYCCIKLKDASKTITMQSYLSPRKYRDAWKTLIQSHEAAGQIQPSNSSSASPSFLVPKTDQTVLPCWVNNY